MSMLAEKKRKQKWSLNPRGKDWAQDTNKFGHKMLEKMGWSQGKGLGAKEDGIREHIKVSYKNDSKGLGHKDKNDQWTEHESNFSALLSSLGGTENTTNEIKVSSLEAKSQKSRARVHYRKFTRGKDLSRYSEKDLANIFGKKSLDELKSSKKKCDRQKEAFEKDDLNEENQPKSNFVINSGLMSDYFKKKLPSFGNGLVVGNNGVLKKAENSDSESELRPSFGFGFSSKKAEKILGVENSDTTGKPSFVSFVNCKEDTPQKNSKNKRKSEDFAEMEIDTPSKRKKTDSSFKETKNKKKKNRKNAQDSIGLNNPAFDPMHSTPIKMIKHTLDIIEESVCEDTFEQQAEHLEVSVQVHKNDQSAEKPTKRERRSLNLSDKNSEFNQSSKKTAEKLNFSEDSLEISVRKRNKKESILKSEDQPYDVSIKKKSKKRKDVNLNEGIENPYFNTSVDSEETNSVAMITESLKHKSKKNKRKLGEDIKGVENQFFNGSVESEQNLMPQSNPYELKTKEKKKKKKYKDEDKGGLANPTFCENSSPDNSVTKNFEVKRKSKKIKPKETDIGLDNPALNLSDNIEDNFELMLNIATTPVRSKINKEEQSFKSPKFTSGVQRRKSVRFSDVTRERIIPTKEEIKKLEESQDSDIELDLHNDSLDIEGRLKDDATIKSSKLFRIKKKSKKNTFVGLDNGAYDAQINNLEENINSISKTLDQYQAELENDINEAKMKSVEISDLMVGEVGNEQGDNERLPDGSVKLKFKYAKFGKTLKYHDAMIGPKKVYKHLIKGDITLDFKESNLHEIQGYACEKVI